MNSNLMHFLRHRSPLDAHFVSLTYFTYVSDLFSPPYSSAAPWEEENYSEFVHLTRLRRLTADICAPSSISEGGLERVGRVGGGELCRTNSGLVRGPREHNGRERTGNRNIG